MAYNSFIANEGTQQAILTDNTGGTSSAGTVIAVQKVDISPIGTAGTIWNGNVGVSSGTINLGTSVVTSGSIAVTAGTVAVTTNGTIASGSIAVIAGTIASVGTIGTLGLGSVVVNTLPNLPQGSINVTAGTIATLGTMGTVGLLNTVTTVSNLTNGSINVTAGTIGTVAGVGVVSVLTKGTISLGSIGGVDANAVAQVANPIGVGGTDSGGTIRTMLVDSTGVQRSSGSMVMTVGTVTVLPNLPQGSINVTSGTIATLGTMGTLGTVLGMGTLANQGSLTNVGQVYNAGTLQGGTINTGTVVMTAGTLTAGTLTSGTISSGTINAGTFTISGGTINNGTLSPIPTIANVTYGTHGTTGVSIFGTLAGGTGSGAGTEIFCTSVSLSIPSTGGSQDVSIGWGTNAGTFHAGTGLIVRGNFPPGGGIQKTFWPPINSGTQAQLCVFQAGAGTADVNVSYFITASTL